MAQILNIPELTEWSFSRRCLLSEAVITSNASFVSSLLPQSTVHKEVSCFVSKSHWIIVTSACPKVKFSQYQTWGSITFFTITITTTVQHKNYNYNYNYSNRKKSIANTIIITFGQLQLYLQLLSLGMFILIFCLNWLLAIKNTLYWDIKYVFQCSICVNILNSENKHFVWKVIDM
jgi:hypothetical protein